VTVLAQQHIKYEQIQIIQIENDIYDLEKRKILKYNKQWSIALEKSRKYINQLIREGKKATWKVYNNIKIYKYNIIFFFFV
jgi:hypothetical protein